MGSLALFLSIALVGVATTVSLYFAQSALRSPRERGDLLRKALLLSFLPLVVGAVAYFVAHLALAVRMFTDTLGPAVTPRDLSGAVRGQILSAIVPLVGLLGTLLSLGISGWAWANRARPGEED